MTIEKNVTSHPYSFMRSYSLIISGEARELKHQERSQDAILQSYKP